MKHEMTWEEKLNALQHLASHFLKMRRPGDWYIHASLGIKKDCLLCCEYGQGKTPQEAVDNHWDIYTNLGEGQTIVVDSYKASRKEYVWDNFMWKQVN